ncbi:hypothetical protein A33M_2220 [Rhodovulum sp. PH10]|uniref:SEL1-like repeat protein n=1 Tax=Rhodovulum sp. PH10 TaxID=1187851 RepID=UPI00027C2501|nr:SEL1-like repeat protein [Rhodovulum sp. PH10]EJW12310.1 hypothetical protein A33M_2220 [Rhodovulum sp. PH10]
MAPESTATAEVVPDGTDAADSPAPPPRRQAGAGTGTGNGAGALRATPDRDIAALCDRFETITRHLERVLESTLEEPAETAAVRPAKARRTMPDASSLDRVIAEIAERQRALDGGGPPVPSMFAPVLPAEQADGAEPPLDLSRLEAQLKAITLQLETLRSPCRAEELVSELREELREIGRAVHDQVPRNAFEALETEVRALAERLDATRGAGPDAATLAPIEQGLAEVREAVASLAPVELAGSINTLFHKIDQVSTEGFDPTVVQQLEEAVGTLRGIVAQVASGDVLAALVQEVRGLAEKVERHVPAGEPVEPAVLANLERQISGIAETLARGAPVAEGPPMAVPMPAPLPEPRPIEPLMASLVEKLERFDLMAPRDDEAVFRPLEARLTDLGDKIEKIVGTDPAAIAQIEERIIALADKLERLEGFSREHPEVGPIEGRLAQLVEKIEASESRLEMLPALERGMAELLAHVEGLQKARTETPSVEPVLKALARDVEGIRLTQEDSDRRTRESLEAAHGTIGRVVDRLAAIETDLRSARTSEPRTSEARAPEPRAPEARAPVPPPTDRRPAGELLRANLGAPLRPDEAPATAGVAGPALSAEARSPDPRTGDARTGDARAAEARPGDTRLPPDAPIEPGSGPPWFRGGRSAADRIAASQAALGSAAAEPAAGARPNFIMAARRAAQAASEQQAQAQAAAGIAPDGNARSRKLSDRVKSLFVTTSVIVIGLALLPIGVATLSGSGGGSSVQVAGNRAPQPQAPATVPAATASADPAAASAPALVPPSDLAAIERKIASASPSAKALLERHFGRAGQAEPTQQATTAPPAPYLDVTGSLPAHPGVAAATPLAAPPAGAGTDMDEDDAAAEDAQANGSTADGSAALVTAEPWPDALPQGISSRALAAGVVARDPAAAFEIGMRYAEGRGVPVDLPAAASWFGRAAAQGLAPAAFRLGSLYEKGRGVKKDLSEARRLYLAAAERGNANAMHNIAVLYAEGIDGRPDFAKAAEWFVKAARYGVADSQFNLAILYARGIGVQANLAEAYKWFAIAAQNGDRDAGRKRDEVGAKLDQQSLTAARLAAQTFVAMSPPEGAMTVKPPPGGWEDATAGEGKTKPRRAPHAQSARL